MNDAYKVMLWAWAFVLLWIPLVIYTNRKQHPKVLFFLFMVELWERFSYYGMRAFLVFYLTKSVVTGAFGWEKTIGNGIYAAYGALVYLTPIMGGYLAEKVLGYRHSIIWGAILMAAGQFTLFTSEGSKILLYIGLGFLIIGNGFFKPNISSLIGRLYPKGDNRRDSAFTIFYMGINIGAFLAPLTCGAVAEIEGWKYGFLLAGCGMITGLSMFLYTWKLGLLEDRAEAAPDAVKEIYGFPAKIVVYAGTFILIPLIYLLIDHNNILDYILGSVGLLAIGYMFYLSFQYEQVERQRIWVIIVLLFFTTIFWAFFELAGSALNLFTEENVDKRINLLVFSFEVKASQFQALNALFIVLFAPLFTYLWLKMDKRGVEPAAPVKFAMGIILLGLGFLILNVGKPFAHAGMMPAIFLILLYLLHTLGELALSPVGLSLVTRLAPAKIVAFMMGFWFLSSSIAHQAGKLIANETVAAKDATKEQTLDLALSVFNDVGLFAVGAGVFLLLISRVLTKWMHMDKLNVIAPVAADHTLDKKES